VEQYVEVAKRHGMTPAEMALAWVNTRWFVSSNIIGATSMEQLKENIKAFDISELSESCLSDIADVYRRYRDPSFN
jgi:aryl-alcohol dehydrogenase-like predicted oxidoreductase